MKIMAAIHGLNLEDKTKDEEAVDHNKTNKNAASMLSRFF